MSPACLTKIIPAPLSQSSSREKIFSLALFLLPQSISCCLKTPALPSGKETSALVSYRHDTQPPAAIPLCARAVPSSGILCSTAAGTDVWVVRQAQIISP